MTATSHTRQPSRTRRAGRPALDPDGGVPIPAHPGCSYDPDPQPAGTVELTGWTVTALAELLGIVEEFLRTAGPATHAELAGYLADQHPPADPCWLIDMLGFNALHLRNQLGAGAAPTAVASVQDNWQPRDDRVDPVTFADQAPRPGQPPRPGQIIRDRS